MAQGSASLKFEGEWVETGAPFGDRRRFAVQYHLGDDTVEMLDRTSAYSSGGLFTKYLQRQRLPRMPLDPGTEGMLPTAHPAYARGLILPDPAAVERAAAAARARYEPSRGATQRAKFVSPITGRPGFSTAEHLSASSSAAAAAGATAFGSGASAAAVAAASARYVRGIPVLSSLAGSPEYVTAAEFVCGGVVSVYGRPLLLRSCDAFTVAFCLHSFGFDMRELFVREATAAAPTGSSTGASAGGVGAGPASSGHGGTAAGAPAAGRRLPVPAPGAVVPLPPHVGALAVGSEEETRRNASKLVPTYRRTRDFDRYYQLGAKALRFSARLDPATCDPEDARRRFVVSFYLEDNTLSVGEMTGVKPGHGAAVARWLQRGRYRNALAPPDAEAMEALGIRPGINALPPAVAAAYDRIYGAARDKIGYTESSGAQGYGGGIYGKAGCVGVESPADMGVRDAALHALRPIPRHFEVGDFAPGAPFRLEHVPGLAFTLEKPDAWTASFLAARAAHGSGCVGADGREVEVDPKDVYVPENSVPVPSMPLEAGARGAADAEGEEGGEYGAAAGGGGSAAAEAEAEAALQTDCLLVAKILSGVAESARRVVKQADKHGRGYAPAGLVAQVLRSYGVQPPACERGVLERVLAAYTLDFDAIASAAAAREASLVAGGALFTAAAAAAGAHPAGGSPDAAGGCLAAGAAKRLARVAGSPDITIPRARPEAPPAPGSRIGSLADPLAGPFLRDFASHEYRDAQMVDYTALFAGLHAATARQMALQPRIDKLLSQLRAALLSSRSHLRKVFRDLDVAGEGAVTMPEFRHMLARHNLDVGISDAQLRVLMQRFPPAGGVEAAAAAAAAGRPPAISWDGFVRALLEVETLSPEELATFLNFVRGLGDRAEDGVGSSRAVPQVRPHANVTASWTPASADPAPYLAAAAEAAGGGAGGGSGTKRGFGDMVEARLLRPHTAPAAAAAASAPGASSFPQYGGAAIDARMGAPHYPHPHSHSHSHAHAGGEYGCGYEGEGERAGLPAGHAGPSVRPHTSAGLRMASGGPPSLPPASRGASLPASSAPSSRSGSVADAGALGGGAGSGYAGSASAAPPGSSPLQAQAGKHAARVTFDAPAKPPAVPAYAAASSARAPTGVSSRPAAQVGTVDVLAALAGSPDTARVLQSLHATFARRRFDLYRALSLFDTTHRGALNLPSFVAAVTSAGLRLTRAELEAVKGAMLAQAACTGAGPSEQDVWINHTAFFDALFPRDADAGGAGPGAGYGAAPRPRTAAAW
jgi:Ca2+-binding EF-hand superfamily protein